MRSKPSSFSRALTLMRSAEGDAAGGTIAVVHGLDAFGAFEEL
jgi:hypothetical protein